VALARRADTRPARVGHKPPRSVVDVALQFRHKPWSWRSSVGNEGGVPCDDTTILITSHAFETSRKRRRGLSVRNERRPRSSRCPRRQGIGREARTQRSVSVWIGTQLSRSAASAPAGLMAASATTTSEISCGGSSFTLPVAGCWIHKIRSARCLRVPSPLAGEG
jgi:hypothetical protein